MGTELLYGADNRGSSTETRTGFHFGLIDVTASASTQSFYKYGSSFRQTVLSGFLEVSRTLLLPGLAGCQSQVQTDCSGCSLGDHSTAFHNVHLYNLLWRAG